MFLGVLNEQKRTNLLEHLILLYNEQYSHFERHEFICPDGLLSFYCWTPKNSNKPFHVYQSDHHTLLIIGNLFNSCQFDFHHFVLSYENSGLDCLKTLNGEFSGIFVDHETKTHYSFKDHTGTVPLTLYKRDEVIYFGSEERVLLKNFISNIKLKDEFIAAQFYSFEPNYAIQATDSFLKVLGGSYVSNEKYTNIRYWKPEEISVNKVITSAEVESKLKQLLSDSISDRLLIATKEIGVHLSGGLDSAIVSGFLREQYDKSIFGFSWSPPGEFDKKEDTVYDERDEVLSLSRRLNIPVDFTPFTEEDFLSEQKMWRFPLDFPYERNLLKACSSHNVGTIFSGLGGDEFIGLQKIGFLHQLFRHGKWQTFFAYCHEKGFAAKLKFMINEGLIPLRNKPMLTKKFSKNLLPYLPKTWKNESKQPYRAMFKSPKDCMNATIQYHHIEARCEHWYNLGAHLGVNYTYPLLDKRIIEFCYSLPPDIFYAEKVEKVLIRKLAMPYATTSMLKRERTLDPILFANQLKIETNALPKLIEQFKNTKQLPELKFFDLTKLDSEIENCSNGNDLLKSKLLYILKYYLHAYYFISSINEKHDQPS